MRVWAILACLLTIMVLGGRVWAQASALLASFELDSEIQGWAVRHGQVERVKGPTTDDEYYLRFDYEPTPEGWPALVIATPVLKVSDWSSYDYMSVDLYNPGNASEILILRLDDANRTRHNRSIQLPPQQWVRWSIPVRELPLDTKSITAAHYHFDRPAVGGSICLDNWRLVKGEVVALQQPGDEQPFQDVVEVYTGPPEYQVVVEDTMTKVRIDAPFPGEMLNRAVLSAAGNEAEGFQLVLMPRGMDLFDVTLEASALERDGGGGTIPADRVVFNQVGYVKTTWPGYKVERVGWYPDPLLDPESFSVRRGDVQPVWVTIRVPEGTLAGTYTGTVTVQPANADSTTIPVTLRVWDFAVPREGSLPLAFTYFEDSSIRIHGVNQWYAKGLKQKYFDLILDHRLAPDNIYRREPPHVDDVKYWDERGLTAFNVTQVGSQPSYSEWEIRTTLEKIAEALEIYGLAGLDRKAYVYGFDEIPPSVYPGLKAMYGAIGQRFPDLKRLVAMRIAPEVYGYVDAWANTIETYNPSLADERRAAGEEVWLYLSMSGRHPYPNWFIEYPGIEARLVWWLGYLYGIDGFLYYAINHYNSRSGGTLPTPIDVTAGPYTTWDPASYVSSSGAKFNGDGLLIYAGSEGPLSSVRLANVRDGLEDYEYLRLLEKRLIETGKAIDRSDAAQQVKAMISEVVSGLTSFTHDPATLRRVRTHLAQAIEALKD